VSASALTGQEIERRFSISCLHVLIIMYIRATRLCDVHVRTLMRVQRFNKRVICHYPQHESAPGFLEELRNRVSIASVVGRKVTWDMRKSNQAKGDFWAPCPFHQEKSASFHVDDRKGFYYCFGCHAKGDALSFLRETENLGFMEAVELLAREAGMTMPAATRARPRNLTSGRTGRGHGGRPCGFSGCS
jgi:hypothetical protein